MEVGTKNYDNLVAVTLRVHCWKSLEKLILQILQSHAFVPPMIGIARDSKELSNSMSIALLRRHQLTLRETTRIETEVNSQHRDYLLA